MANWHATLTEARQGIMLHYDASRSDKGAVTWMRDKECKVSYQVLVLDDGAVERIAPDNTRAYHAGACRPSIPSLRYKGANSAFYGVAIAATSGEHVTPLQLASVVRVTVGYFLRHGWGADQVWRIVGHDTECWPRGRKTDPRGPDASHPVLDVLAVRREVQSILSEDDQ